MMKISAFDKFSHSMNWQLLPEISGLESFTRFRTNNPSDASPSRIVTRPIFHWITKLLIGNQWNFQLKNCTQYCQSTFDSFHFMEVIIFSFNYDFHFLSSALLVCKPNSIHWIFVCKLQGSCKKSAVWMKMMENLQTTKALALGNIDSSLLSFQKWIFH